MKTKKVLLAILDGWGHGPKRKADAIAQACTPFINSLYQTYPNAELVTYGEEVGLPEGQMGNSEVGHLNIGAGRIVWQELARINKAIRERELHQNNVLLAAIAQAQHTGNALHLIGLVSDGGVHSHLEHLKALCDITTAAGLKKIFIHAFTDGRDTDPKSGVRFLSNLEAHIANTSVKIATVTGRYFAMDRDKRWERVKIAYDALTNSPELRFESAVEGLKASYAQGITDEFIKPFAVHSGSIQAHDTVVCFNFRTDRCREITEVLTQNDMPEQQMHTLPLHYVTMTRYDAAFRGIHVMFEKDDISLTLGEVLSNNQRTQVRIAETEKYPHVTFFFSGGREKPFAGERRLMVSSPKVATYDLQPEMSAEEITDSICQDIETNAPDFICLNYANADMVGHTGVFSAAVRAVETVNNCTERLLKTALANGYEAIVIADHGNSDYMLNDDGTPNTAHTTNPVPIFHICADPTGRNIRNGKLADVAPTILHIMGIAAPEAMTGNVLID